MTKKLFCFGFGYTANYLSKILKPEEFRITGTNRSLVTNEESLHNIEFLLFDQIQKLDSDITHILISIPPRGNTDIVMEKFGQMILKLPSVQWIGYLSSTGVYGDNHGNWVDEETHVDDSIPFSRPRIHAERVWYNLWQNHKAPVHIFRLSGIYGPTRSEIEKALAGQTRIIEKPDHVFSRIHVEDIAQTLKASMNNPKRGEIYNLSDDMPSSHAEVVYYAHQLLNTTPPLPETYEEAEMSDMLRYFYSKSNRIRNQKIKTQLGIKLLYPDYRAGISAIFRARANH